MSSKLCVGIVPLFNELAHDEQELIERLVQHRSVARGEVVVSPDRSGGMIIVRSGRLRVYQLSEDGSEHVVRILDSGDYEGELWLYGGRNENLFISGESDSEICVIAYDEFNRLLESSSGLAIRLLKLSIEKMSELGFKNSLLAMDSIEDRIVAYLEKLQERHHSGKIVLPMKLKDLALYLGITPETLSRKLHLLEEEGIIRRRGRTIELNER